MYILFMKNYKLLTTWGAYPVISFRGKRIGGACDKIQKKLKNEDKAYIYHELTLYKSKKNIIWHIQLRSSDEEEDGHSFVGFSSSKRQIVIELKNFNVLHGIKLPEISDPEYNKKKNHKLQFLTNNYNKTRSECLSKIKSLQFKLD